MGQLSRKELSRLGAKVRRAWVAGKIPREPCVRCGTTADLVAHHEDYSKPLDVVWLCRTHHVERHKEIREEAKQCRSST